MESNEARVPRQNTPDRTTLSPDRPVSKPEDDRLGYAPIARRIAESIAAMSPAEGFVMALYAPWGSGKSTVLNFVEHYLGEMSEAEDVISLHFNPWWFSGHIDLAQTFFGQLDAELSTMDAARRKKKSWEKFRGGLANLGEAVAKAKGVPLIGPYLGAGEAVAAAVRPAAKDVPQLKKEVGDALRQANLRLLIIIDDIDRLTAEEIRQVFRVVKALADFPNTVYLLAFDKGVAVQALGARAGCAGFRRGVPRKDRASSVYPPLAGPGVVARAVPGAARRGAHRDARTPGLSAILDGCVPGRDRPLPRNSA